MRKVIFWLQTLKMPVNNYQASVKICAFISLFICQGRSTEPINSGGIKTACTCLSTCICVCVCVSTKPVCSPLRWAHHGWPGVLGSGCSCRCGGSWAGRPGRFSTWSSSPSHSRGSPRSARLRWRWMSCSSAELADKRNTGRCKQKPSLLWSGCVARSTQTPREKKQPWEGNKRGGERRGGHYWSLKSTTGLKAYLYKGCMHNILSVSNKMVNTFMHLWIVQCKAKSSESKQNRNKKNAASYLTECEWVCFCPLASTKCFNIQLKSLFRHVTEAATCFVH